MEFKDIKLIGVDLDGTLLDDNKKLAPELKEKIKHLCENSIQIVPITGRPFSGIPSDILSINEIQYAITSNGSQIIDTSTKSSVFSFQIDNKTVNTLIDIIESTDCIYEVFTDHFGFINEKDFDFHINRFKDTPFGEYLINSRKSTPSIKKMFSDKNKMADEIFIICNDNNSREELANTVSKIDSIQICKIADKYLEITKKGIDKGYALEKLCEYLNIDIENTMAFGDGENDLQFLSKAKIAVAMENAVDEVKEKANIITKSNNDNGVLEILNMIKV